MKRFTKIKLFTQRLVGTVAIVASSITLATATTTVPVPNTFSPGTTISSSAMNSNFTAVTNQMPGVNEVGISKSSVSVTASYQNLAQVSITAPTAGFVVVRFDGSAYVANTGDSVYLAASDISANTGSIGTGDLSVVIYPSTATGMTLPFSHTRVYPVTAGPHTFYAVVAGKTDTDGIYGTLTVEFFPNSF